MSHGGGQNVAWEGDKKSHGAGQKIAWEFSFIGLIFYRYPVCAFCVILNKAAFLVMV